LNAKNHEKEGEIIAQAGALGAVTVATNMAGRGVDISLGGNPSTEESRKKAIEAGGLFVIGTERHEARRIDNQLRGRTGRQGDPGTTQFFVSLEDDVIRIFGGDKIKGLMERFNFPDDALIENPIISKSIESAQTKIEGANFDSRKYVLEYDDVLNKHREVVYKKRKEILIKGEKKELKEEILPLLEKEGFSSEDYEKKEKELGGDNMREVEKLASLRSLDFLWVEHLENMESLRESVRLRAYGQRDPLIEYKSEGRKMFNDLLSNYDKILVNSIFKASVNVQPQQEEKRETVQGKKEIGRNDPCPCGSGKKYKKCCGK
jgi:preprotein translocase subunit SecA